MSWEKGKLTKDIIESSFFPSCMIIYYAGIISHALLHVNFFCMMLLKSGERWWYASSEDDCDCFCCSYNSTIFLHSIPVLKPVRQQSLRSVRIYVADLPFWYRCCLLFWGSSPSNKEILLVFLAYSKIMRAFLSSLLFCSVWYKWQCIEAGYTIGLHRTWSVQGKWVKKGSHFFLQGFPEIHFFRRILFSKAT